MQTPENTSISTTQNGLSVSCQPFRLTVKIKQSRFDAIAQQQKNNGPRTVNMYQSNVCQRVRLASTVRRN